MFEQLRKRYNFENVIPAEARIQFFLSSVLCLPSSVFFISVCSVCSVAKKSVSPVAK